jgi:hypothetical protein
MVTKAKLQTTTAILGRFEKNETKEYLTGFSIIYARIASSETEPANINKIA